MRFLAIAIAAAIAVCLALAPGAPRAQAAPTGTTFVAVDGVRWSSQLHATFYVRGVVQGESAPREVTFMMDETYGAAARVTCERFLLLAMERPGRYVVTLERVPALAYTACSLSRVTP